MATATATRRATDFQHLPGCPVAAHPDDEALAARVETYREYRRPLDVREDKPDVIAGNVVVTHCCECGAMSYEKES